MRKEGSYVGFGWIIAGLLFLFVPSVGILDLLPDFIGAALILHGTRRLSDLDGKIASARSVLFKLFYILLFKFAISIYLISLNDETTTMTFTFVFAIIETVMWILVFSGLLDGVNYFASRCDSQKADRDFASVTTTAWIFFITRAVLCVIPELVVLTNDDYQVSVDVTHHSYLYENRNLILLFCLILSLAVGVLWLYTTVRYLGALMREKPFIERAKARWREEILPDTGMFIRRDYKVGLGLIFAGSLFFSSFLMDGVDVLPNILGVILVAVGYGRLRKHTKTPRIFVPLSCLTALLSLASYVFSVYVAGNYYRGLSDEAAAAYHRLAYVETAETAVLLLFFAVVLGTVINGVKIHVGSELFSADAFQIKDIEKTRKNYLRGAYALLCTFLFPCVFHVFSAFSFYRYDSLWIPSAALFLVYSLILGKYFLNLNEQIDRKYM